MPELRKDDFEFVFDTTLLSNFAVVEHIALLEKLYRGQVPLTSSNKSPRRVSTMINPPG